MKPWILSVLPFLFACGCGTPTPTAPLTDAGGGAGIGNEDGGAPIHPADAGGADGGTDDAGTTPPDAGTTTPDAGAGPIDLDQDGLPDAFEAEVAQSYLPFLSIDASDGCPLGGIVYRVRKHPKDPALLHVLMVHLFEKDCGITSHAGDNELFAFTVDPSKTGAAGITAMIAIAHQNTTCERTTKCGVCNGLSACEAAADGRPIVYASKNKHAKYVSRNGCNIGFCFDACAVVGNTAQMVPLLNVGEPQAPLVTNLSTQGFITAANGWTEQTLFDFNPWEPMKEFGKAGVVADDLVDPAADTEPCAAK